MTQDRTLSESAFGAQARAILARAEAEKAVSHAGLRGAATEELLADFVREHLPSRFGVASGLIAGSDDTTSAQTDLIVYDRDYTSPMPSTTCVIPAESVAASIEIKTTLRTPDIRKTICDVARIKSLPQRAGQLDKIEEGVQVTKCVVGPWRKQATLLSLWSEAPLDTVALYWHKHFLSVPFGYQLDTIVCLDRGVISFATHSPGQDRLANGLSALDCLDPSIATQDGESVLVWPLLTDDNWERDCKIAFGPRVPLPGGSVLFMAITECKVAALGMWFRGLLSHIDGELLLREQRRLAFPKLDESFPHREFHAIPLAIAADPDRVANEGRDYVLGAVSVLLDYQNRDYGAL